MTRLRILSLTRDAFRNDNFNDLGNLNDTDDTDDLNDLDNPAPFGTSAISALQPSDQPAPIDNR
jgi:hypothetical protein